MRPISNGDQVRYRVATALLVLIGGILAAVTAWAQEARQTQPPAQARFESADVHVSAPSKNLYHRGPSVRGTRYEILNATTVDLISIAYGMDSDKVLGGPSWLEWDRFDVIGKVPANPSPEARKEMLQGVLADRFHLKFHNDQKPLPALALVATGKHPQLKPAAGEGSTGCRWANQPKGDGLGPLIIPQMIEYSCENVTLAAFATAARGFILPSDFFGNRPIIDRTELKGSWDFNFKYSIVFAARGAAPPPDVITFFNAVEKLGLKLEPVTTPLPVLVVDSVDKTPTENAAGVREALARSAPPKEFEVADIKPSAADARSSGIRTQPGGRVTAVGITLRTLIQQAYDLTDETLIGAPKWLDSDHYDIFAKASIEGFPPGQQIEYEDVLPMIQAMLKERFKLAVHTEERDLPAFTLTAVKPKMKKSEATTRSRCGDGPGTDGKDPRDKNPALSRVVHCENISMAQFAVLLQNLAGGYIRSHPILDATGLEGGYDFLLSFSPVGMMNGGAKAAKKMSAVHMGDAAPGAAEPGAASDPTGGISLYEAMEKELGLKLEQVKRPGKVLVIDHIEQKPTEN